MYKTIKHVLGAGLLASALLLGINTQNATAQLGEIGEVLRAGAQDANALTQAYLNPFGKGFGYVLNSGWYGEAKPHKFLGFDATLRLGAAMIPVNDQTFNATNIGLQRLEFASGPSGVTATSVPTIASEIEGATTFNLKDVNNNVITQLELPGGIGAPLIAAPMVQAGIGVGFGTDITVRFLPTINDDNFGEFGLMGASVRHSLGWLPIIGMLPVDISLQAGFTELSLNTPLSVRPEAGAIWAGTGSAPAASHWDGQKLETKATATTANLLVGKNLSLLIFGIGVYGGVGVEQSSLTIKSLGNYPLAATVGGMDAYDTISNPLNLEFKNEMSTRLTVGGRVKLLGLLQVSAEYIKGQYDLYSVGVGISIR